MSVKSENTHNLRGEERQLDSDSDDHMGHTSDKETTNNHPEAAALALIESATGVSPPIDTADKPASSDDGDGEFTPNYATRITLTLAMVAINLSVFLMFLDNSILATVRAQAPGRDIYQLGLIRVRLFQPSRINSTLLQISDGTSALTSLHCKYRVHFPPCAHY